MFPIVAPFAVSKIHMPAPPPQNDTVPPSNRKFLPLTACVRVCVGRYRFACSVRLCMQLSEEARYNIWCSVECYQKKEREHMWRRRREGGGARRTTVCACVRERERERERARARARSKTFTRHGYIYTSEYIYSVYNSTLYT